MKVLFYTLAFALGLVFVVVLLAPSYWLNAYVIQYYFNSFLTPFGLPAIGMLHALALGFFVRFLTFSTATSKVYHYVAPKKDEMSTDDKWFEVRGALAALYGWPLFYLFAAWLVNQYI